MTAAFVATPIHSHIGVVLVGRLDEKLWITERLSASLRGRRDAAKVQHSTLDLLRQRAYPIACRYEDASDVNSRRHDAGFQLAVGRVPRSEAVARR